MRLFLLGLTLIPFLSEAQVAEIIPAITKSDSHIAERFAKAESDPDMLDRSTQSYFYAICGYDKCDADQKERLQKKIVSILRKTWEYGIELEAKRLNEIHETIAECSPEAKKLFAGEGSATCAQLVKCEGPIAGKLYGLMQELEKSGSFKRPAEKDEFEFEGLDLSSLNAGHTPVLGGYRSGLINGLSTYKNKKGGREQDGIATGINKLPEILTLRSISCDRDRKVKSDGSVKSEKNSCTVVLSKNISPGIIYGKAVSFFTNSIEGVKEECIPVEKKKKRR